MAAGLTADDERQHSLALCVLDGVPTVICVACGARASRTVNHLKITCMKDSCDKSAKARLPPTGT